MITLINPNLVLLRNDPFTTGVVYMPIGLATFVSTVQNTGYECTVVDAFGERPNQIWFEGELVFRGLFPEEIAKKISLKTSIIFIYAINLTYHNSLLHIIQAVRARVPHASIVILENTQAVTAYSLCHIQEELYSAGADFIVTGEPEERGIELIHMLLSNDSSYDTIDGIGFKGPAGVCYNPPSRCIKDLDILPFPQWDKFPLDNYWQLRYAHGPLTSSRYLPILTSRGCPFHCRFCVVPDMNKCGWRRRSPGNVVDEIEYFQHKYGVREFHIEDLNPTVNEVRTKGICQEIISRGLQVNWKLCSGTKVETIRSEQTVSQMAKAGCKYISISPESGSERLMKLMNKPFDIEHAVRLIGRMRKEGIYSQACFILGFPGETDEDRLLTKKMLIDLTNAGVDEVAVFIVTPVPGSEIYSEFTGFKKYSELNFSPSWRKDYDILNKFRLKLYRTFLIRKLYRRPFEVFKQAMHFLTRRFYTKMEMVPYRAIHTIFLMIMKKLHHRGLQ